MVVVERCLIHDAERGVGVNDIVALVVSPPILLATARDLPLGGGLVVDLYPGLVFRRYHGAANKHVLLRDVEIGVIFLSLR